MKSRPSRWLGLLTVVFCVGGVLWIVRPEAGSVQVRVVERNMDSFGLLVHNGTRRRFYISDFTSEVRAGTAVSIVEIRASSNTPASTIVVEPNSEKTWLIGWPLSPPGSSTLEGQVFIPPWTGEEAEQARSRAQKWPKPIRDWLLRKRTRNTLIRIDAVGAGS